VRFALVAATPGPLLDVASLLPAGAEVVHGSDPSETPPAVDVVVAADEVARTALARAPGGAARIALVLEYGLDGAPGGEAEVDRWAAGHQAAAEAIAKAGVPTDLIEVTGIPVPPGFEPHPDLRAARRTAGLDDDAHVVLVQAAALEALDALLVQLALLAPPPTLLFDVGDDALLAETLRALVPRTSLHAKMFCAGPDAGRFTALADVVIGPPSAAAAARAFSVGAAFVAVGRAPRGALDAALADGAARLTPSVGRLAADVDLLRHADRLAVARAAAASLVVRDASERLRSLFEQTFSERDALVARRRRRGLPVGLEDLAVAPPTPRRPPPPSIDAELEALRKRLR